MRARGVHRYCLAAAALAALAAGRGEDAPSTPTRNTTPVANERPAAPPSDDAQLRSLLAARAAALQSGDARALAKTATGAQLVKDRRALRAARALPLERVSLVPKRITVDGDRARLRVELSYRFSGIPTRYAKTSQIRAHRTHAGWRVQADRPAAGVLAPWEHRAYKAQRSRHFLALTPKRLATDGLLSDLEAGYAKLRQGLKRVKPPRRVLVIVAETAADTRALTKDIASVQALTAISETQYSVQGPAKRVAEVWGQRVFVFWPQYRDRTAEQRRTVITHELVHTALAKRTSGRTPPWLYEGIALYVSGDDRTGEAGAILGGALRDPVQAFAAGHVMSLARLSSSTAFARLQPLQLRFAYVYASAAAFAIADRWGASSLLRLLSAFNSEQVKGAPGRRLADRAVRRALRVSLTTLEATVKSYATARARF